MTTQIGEIVQVRTAEQVRNDILTELAALLGMSDQNLGAWIRTVCYAFGVELGSFYYQLWRGTRSFYTRKATGTALNYRAQDFSLIREPALQAIGFQTFIGTPGTVIAPGTQVARPVSDIADQLLFQTVQPATIPPTGIVEVPIQALRPGKEGNLAAKVITELITSNSGITSTYNATLTRLGREEEDDDTLRARILRTIAGLSRGTVPSIRNGAIDFRVQSMTLNGSIEAGDTEIPVDEDLNLIPIATTGTMWIGFEVITYTGLNLSNRPHRLIGVTRGQNGTIDQAHQDATSIREYIPGGRGERITSVLISERSGTVDVIIDDGTEQGVSAELVGLIRDRLNGDTTDRNPGYRGGGIQLNVHPSPLTFVGTACTLSVKQGYIPAQVQVVVQEKVVRVINALGIATPLYAYEVACAVQDTEGVETVKDLELHLYLPGSTTFQVFSFIGDNSADLTPQFPMGVLRTDSSRISVGI